MGVLAWAGAVRARAPAKVRQIGVLSPFSASVAAPLHQAFRSSLNDLGWIEGKNVNIEYRYAEGSGDRLYDLAADLVRLKVDVIVTSVTADALAAQKATRTIPIVVAVGDPVALGLVESLARPGGNVTGLSTMSVETAGKRLELLTDMLPKLSSVAVLWDPQSPISTLAWKETQLPARRLGVQLHSLEVRSPDELDQAVENATRSRADAIDVMPGPVFTSNLHRIADLAAKSRLPSIFPFPAYADAGGLATFGPDRVDLFRRAATFVDKILKGAKPSDLPIDRAIRFELVINMKTAKALDITIPESVLFRADRLIK
jgi:putative ABC transport system substrate-binding protein